MKRFSKNELLAYVRLHRLAVIATIGDAGGPQSALVGVGSTDALEIVFDTVSTSRKHANLEADHRIAVTFGGPGQKTLQLEGIALPVSVTGNRDVHYREAYYAALPDGRERLLWPDLVYWRVVPQWARYSDYDNGSFTTEFHWSSDLAR